MQNLVIIILCQMKFNKTTEIKMQDLKHKINESLG